MGYKCLIHSLPNLKISYKIKKGDKEETQTIKSEEEEKMFKEQKKTALDIIKIYGDFLNLCDSIKTSKLKNTIIDFENEQAKDNWTKQSLWFLNLKAHYQRESLRNFVFDETKKFSKMFSDVKGDLYGLSLSLNYSVKRKKFPNTVFARISGEAGRSSNINKFTTSTININGSIGNDVDGNAVIFTNNDTAFIGSGNYQYGAQGAFGFDLYVYPSSWPIGMFCEVGYTFINFPGSTGIKDQEISPLRAGLIFNLKNKEKGKPIIVLQTFMDRTDLSLSPTGNDKDLRFGLGLGVPIYFKW